MTAKKAATKKATAKKATARQKASTTPHRPGPRYDPGIGGVATDEGGRPLTDEGGRPIRLDA